MHSHALLFSDLVESTALVEREGDARAAELFAAHDALARSLLAEHGGREIDRADGFLLLFDAVEPACRFALAYQRGTSGLGLHVRVGIHNGPVVLRANAPPDVARGAKPLEVEGLTKPLAARIMALASGGQTLLSATARRELAAPPAQAEWHSHGHYRLKGIDEPMEIYELRERGQSPFAPPADTPKAYRVVHSGDCWTPARDVRHNLPAERDAFVGRGDELHQIARRLDGGTRLLTLLGPGGTGKTRIARRFGRLWLGDWPGGVYFCDLSEARSLEGIVFAVAAALGVTIGRDDPVAHLGNAIAGRDRCLVILDNFEQIVACSEPTLGRWLDRAPTAAFMVTSRERLHLRGEEVYALEPLALDTDALELFVTRARAQNGGFALNDTNRDTLAQVVRVLDGLPLAIELAAARTRVLSPSQLLERLHDRFQVLAGARGAASRQATLRAAIDWSWQLLEAWEQTALAQCAVFEGAFTLGAAEDVLDLSAWPQAPPVVDVVQALADKSLLRTWVHAHGDRIKLDEPYFGMYISIHEYATERLRAVGDAAVRAAQARHGDHFAGFGSDDAIEALNRHGGVKRRQLLALELDNLVAACSRAAEQGRTEVALCCYDAAFEVLELHGPASLAITLGTRMLGLPGLDDRQRCAVLKRLSLSLRGAGRVAEGRELLEQALVIARTTADRAAEAELLNLLGNLRRQQGDHTFAQECIETALAMQRDLGNRRLEGQALGNLAIIHAEAARYEEARPLFEQALIAHRDVGNRRFEGIDLGNLASLHIDQYELEPAQVQLTQALAIHREMGNRREEGISLHNLGNLHRLRGDDAQAHRDLSDALTIAREVGFRLFEGLTLAQLSVLLAKLGRLDEALACADEALTIHRTLGNRHEQGATLGVRGDVLARLGRLDEAWRAFDEGAAILLASNDPLHLASLIAQRGHAELAASRRDAAARSLAEAEAIAEPLNLPPRSETVRELVRLRERLQALRSVTG